MSANLPAMPDATPPWWNLPARLRHMGRKEQPADIPPELKALEACEAELEAQGIKIELSQQKGNELLAQAAEAGEEEFEAAVQWLDRYTTGVHPKQIEVFRERIRNGKRGSRLADSVMASLNAESQRLRALKTESARYAVIKRRR